MNPYEKLYGKDWGKLMYNDHINFDRYLRLIANSNNLEKFNLRTYEVEWDVINATDVTKVFFTIPVGYTLILDKNLHDYQDTAKEHYEECILKQLKGEPK